MATGSRRGAASAVPGGADAEAGSPSTILDAAQRLFLERGFDGVSLDQVGKAAGLTRQTVYNRFGSKEAVFRAVVDRHWTAVKAEAETCFSEDLDEAAGPAEILRGYAAALVRFVTETDQIAFTRLVIAESRRQPWIAEEFYQVGKAPLVEAFSRCLTRMTDRKLLSCPDTTMAAQQFMGIVQEFIIWPQIMAIGSALKRLPSHRVVIDEAVAMFLGRYGQPPASGSTGKPRRSRTPRA